MKIKMISVHNGDCFLINTDGINILIDGGLKGTYIRSLKPNLIRLQNANENLDYIIITHIDDDHIGGIIKLFGDESIDKSGIRKVIFNSAWTISNSYGLPYNNREVELSDSDNKNTSYSNANTLENKLKELNLLEKSVFTNTEEISELGLIILSPDDNTLRALYKDWKVEKCNDSNCACIEDDYGDSLSDLMDKILEEEDSSLVNRSSIAFIIKDNENCVLMLGDAHIDVVVKKLKELGYSKENKISVDYVKLSHHGSVNNISEEFLDIVNCNRYLISTNGSRFKHPNKKTLAKIIALKQKPIFYFNSDIYLKIFTPDEIEEYKIDIRRVENNRYIGEEE